MKVGTYIAQLHPETPAAPITCKSFSVVAYPGLIMYSTILKHYFLTLPQLACQSAITGMKATATICTSYPKRNISESSTCPVMPPMQMTRNYCSTPQNWFILYSLPDSWHSSLQDFLCCTNCIFLVLVRFAEKAGSCEHNGSSSHWSSDENAQHSDSQYLHHVTGKIQIGQQRAKVGEKINLILLT